MCDKYTTTFIPITNTEDIMSEQLNEETLQQQIDDQAKRIKALEEALNVLSKLFNKHSHQVIYGTSTGEPVEKAF